MASASWCGVPSCFWLADKISLESPKPSRIRLGHIRASPSQQMDAEPSALQGAPPPMVELEFIGPKSAANGSMQVDRVTVASGEKLLRTVMIEKKLEVYGLYGKVMNCGGVGSCGTCLVEIIQGNELLNERTDAEAQHLKKTKPGLSSYHSDPDKGAESLRDLLNAAINAVPEDQRSKTPVRLGATAGLRALPGDSAMNLLEAVRASLSKSSFKFTSEWVSILDGSQEGAFEWVTINYLLGNIGQDYGKTVGVVDLGGGSVQMAYAIPEEEARNAPKPLTGEDHYVKDLKLLGKTYHLYIHSYLHYGLLAARAEVLNVVKEGEGCPCLARGFEGEYTYGSVKYKSLGLASGGDFEECRKLIVKALDKDHACKHMQCTFGGVWNGGAGDGQKKLFVASFFFDRALQAGIIIDPDAVEAKLKPSDFEEVGTKVCTYTADEVGKEYKSLDADDRAYFCLDLAYEYTLLVDGFGVSKEQDITLIKKVKYKSAFVEAAWPLGSAIEVLS